VSSSDAAQRRLELGRGVTHITSLGLQPVLEREILARWHSEGERGLGSVGVDMCEDGAGAF